MVRGIKNLCNTKTITHSKLLSDVYKYFFNVKQINEHFDTKSEVVFFSRRHFQPPVLIQIGGRLLPQSISYKYLADFFYAELRWGTQARYVQKRCLQRLSFLKSIADVKSASLQDYVV
jgi:hypothetical protein